MDAEAFVALLENARQVGTDRWMARCPAHEDKHASLSVRRVDDGRILVHDFGMGCTVTDVCAALGIGVRDLMPPNLGRPYSRPEERADNATRATAGDLLEQIDHWASIVWLCAVVMKRDGALSERDWTELTAAKRGLSDARAVIRPLTLERLRREAREAKK